MRSRSGQGKARRPQPLCKARLVCAIFSLQLIAAFGIAQAQDVRIIKSDAQIDALDPGIKLFVREKMAEGNTRFTDDNVVLSCTARRPHQPATSIFPTRIIRGPIGW
jgi:hypothetical protein